MWCVIPAAGRATRLAAASADRPKALVPVAGRPILDWLLERLAGAVEDACVVVDDPEGPIARELGSSRAGIRLSYVRQPEPRGVGDAVLRAASHVRGSFAVVMGDVFYDRTLGPYVAAWRASVRDGAVLVEPLRDGLDQPAGLVETDGGTVRSIRKGIPNAEEEPSVAGLAGMAVLPPSAFEAGGHLRPGTAGELELEQIIAWLMAERGASFAAIPYEGWRLNINTEEDMKAVNRHLSRKGHA